MTLPPELTDLLKPRPGADPTALRLVAVLALSNIVEQAPDVFQRKLRLEEMQAAIQAAAAHIEPLAEGMMFAEDGDEEDDKDEE